MKATSLLIQIALCISIMIYEVSTASAIDATAVKAYNSGVSFVENGNFDQGIAELKRAISIDQNFADARYNLGMAYHLKAASINKVDPRDLQGATPIQSYRKKWTLGLDELRMAINEFKEVLRLQPLAADAHFKLGLLFDNVGDTENAIAQYREAMRIDPKGPDGLDARSNYALILHVVNGQSKEAIEELRAVLSVNPNHPAKRNIAKIIEGQKQKK